MDGDEANGSLLLPELVVGNDDDFDAVNCANAVDPTRCKGFSPFRKSFGRWANTSFHCASNLDRSSSSKFLEAGEDNCKEIL
jgi:hypothetical protein